MNIEHKRKDFLEYYDKYKDKIYNYFLYRLNFNKALTEDFVSDVFLKALKNFDKFDHNQSFQAWMYKISKNHLINFYKISNREISIEYAEDIAINRTKEIDLGLETEAVFKEINKLEDYSKEILLLRFADGMSNQEIADVLHKENGAIRTHMSRALKLLRNKVKR